LQQEGGSQDCQLSQQLLTSSTFFPAAARLAHPDQQHSMPLRRRAQQPVSKVGVEELKARRWAQQAAAHAVAEAVLVVRARQRLLLRERGPVFGAWGGGIEVQGRVGNM